MSLYINMTESWVWEGSKDYFQNSKAKTSAGNAFQELSSCISKLLRSEAPGSCNPNVRRCLIRALDAADKATL